MNDIKNIFLKFRNHLIIAISIVLISIALINIYYVLEVRVTSNDECLWVNQKDESGNVKLFFNLVKENGVTWNAGIRNGDQLIAINNIKLHDQFQAQGILNSFSSGQYAPYTYLRDGKEIQTTVYVKRLIQFGALASSLNGLIWMLIGFVVLMAKPDGTIQKLFYAIGAATVFSTMNVILQNDFFLHTPELGTFSLIVVGYLWCLGACFLPFMIVYFFWSFPKPFKLLERRWIKILLFVLPSALFLLTFAVAFITYGSGEIHVAKFLGLVYFIVALITLANVIGYISLIINYRRLKTKEEKKPIIIILGALTFGLFTSLYTALIAPAITDTIFNSPEFYTPIILVTVVPIAFGYSIFRYQLMDVSVVIKNTIVYGAATLSVAAIYFFVIYVIGQSMSQVIGTEYQGIIAGVFFIAFALVFQSTKDKFQDFLTARFYPEQFAYQKVLMRFSNEVATVVGLEKILDSMKETFVEALNIDQFGILLKEKKRCSNL